MRPFILIGGILHWVIVGKIGFEIKVYSSVKM
jgi:hypothetical protein